ncbi:COG2958 family protein [Tropicimonas sp. IMCC34043]|uniref:COG2958 family protein n=1 Tax=Tropicimonas sp. IMCC34043 TaxID=2248760 RepID=UPI000E271176|nr:HrgA protein [Tropicimonas sp. IMCC34043]
MESPKFSIGTFVPELLRKHSDERFTAREIANWILKEYPYSVEQKRQRSKASKTPLESDSAMIQQIVAEIGAQRPRLEQKHGIRTTEGRPRKYYYSQKSEEEEAQSDSLPASATFDETTPTIEAKAISEADTYPLLVEFLKKELSVLAKRIDERRSSNTRGTNGNRWLFPDIVGMEDLSVSWDREVTDCAREYADKRTKLWSFEVKLRINSSNVRESFFQAVSNSTWANISYLVTTEIQSALTELRILSGLHGIGVIKLDPENVSESQILIPAFERQDIDWGSVNRLVQQNSDFREFIRLVRQFYQTGDARRELWD